MKSNITLIYDIYLNVDDSFIKLIKTNLQNKWPESLESFAEISENFTLRPNSVDLLDFLKRHSITIDQILER